MTPHEAKEIEGKLDEMLEILTRMKALNSSGPVRVGPTAQDPSTVGFAIRVVSLAVLVIAVGTSIGIYWLTQSMAAASQDQRAVQELCLEACGQPAILECLKVCMTDGGPRP